MLLREFFESTGNEVAIIFGRFNPPHKGHRAAWELAAKSPVWYVGTNKSTVGPKDPLPYEVKVQAMEAIWPDVAKHIIAEISWLTLASMVYEKHGKVNLKCLTDEDWVTKTIMQYNGKEGPHGYYDFPHIEQTPTPRLSSATALRDAVIKGDRKAFSDAAGVSSETKIAGKPFFDLVAEYLLPYADAAAKKGKKVKEAGDNQSPLSAAGKKGSNAADVWGNYASTQDIFRASRGTAEDIDETLDSAYKFKYKGYDGDNVSIYSFTPSKGSKINVSIFYEERTGTGHVTFYRASDDSEEMTGEHPFDAAKILGTVKAIVIYHMKRHPEIKNISFQAAKKDLGRLRAYNAIAKRFGGSSNPDYHKKYASYEFPNVAVAEDSQLLSIEAIYKKHNIEEFGLTLPMFEKFNERQIKENSSFYTFYKKLKDKDKAYNLAKQEVLKNLNKNIGYYFQPHFRIRPINLTDYNVDEEAAGVGIVTKQNSTADVGPRTIKKNLKAFKL